MEPITGHETEVVTLVALTLREAQTLLWAAEGKTAWEAGMILGVRESTAAVHLSHAREKLGASNLPHLITRAFVAGILRARQCAFVIALASQIFVGVIGADLPVEMRRPPTTRLVVRATRRKESPA